MGGAAVTAWSHSRLQAFDTCPKRHLEVDRLVNYPEGPNAQRDFGSELHAALEHYCRSDVPFPPGLDGYQEIGDKVRAIPGEKLFEQKLAIDQHYQPCDFRGPDAWLRVVIDVLVLDWAAQVAAVIDYKTGKRKDDFSQLQLNAAVIFAHYPDIFTVEATYWWLCIKGKPIDRRTYTKHGDLAAIWNKFLPKVKAYENAVQTEVFLPKPSGLCKNYCPVLSCPFHGKSNR
jgi:hypothetical protein